MSEYIVINRFFDKVTKESYLVGDKYPHKGTANEIRIRELSSTNNAVGKPFIKEVVAEVKADDVAEDTEKPKKRGRKAK
jgi:hypothetical protein